MNPFKAGDKIRCINSSSYSWIKEGKEYTVKSVYGSDEVWLVEVSGCSYESVLFTLAAVANGVNSMDTPITFNVKDLKPFQRVVLANGKSGIVSVNGGGDIGVTFAANSWNNAYFESRPSVAGGKASDGYHIVEVYGPPSNAHALNINVKGVMLFKAKDVAAEAARAAALAKLDEAVTAAVLARTTFLATK